MDITRAQRTGGLKAIHTQVGTQRTRIHGHRYTTHIHTHRQGWTAVSVNVCTSTTLSNIWAKGRKEMSTSLELGVSMPWTSYTGEEEM